MIVFNETCRTRCISWGRLGLVRTLSIALAGAILFARSVVAQEDWPYYQHDAAHTGNSNAIINPQLIFLAWSAPSSPTGYSTPVIVGNSIYAMQNQQGFGGLPTTVSSFDLATGAINWSYTGNFVFPSAPGVGAGFVTFVGSTSSSSSLYVLDAKTGALLYTVPIPEGTGSLMPTVFQDPSSGNVTAFVAAAPQVSAISLGRQSGSILWTQTGSFAASIPTVVGNSIVLTGTGQYYAFDQATGARNQFWSGAVSGGNGTTVAYDAARQQFYVRTGYNGGAETLSAYHYEDNFHITLLWQRTGAGIGSGGSVAIGPTGKVYSAGTGVIWELDPATGETLRSIPGLFATGQTPALTKNVLWIFQEIWTFAYDLTSLQLLQTFEGARGSSNSDYDSPGAFADNCFVLDYGTIFGRRGFDVYRPRPTPTPFPTATPTGTGTPAPTATPVATPTATATATPVASPTATPIATATPSPTVTPPPTPTPAATPSATPTASPTPTPTASPGFIGNVSTRLPVGTGDGVLIQGFIAQGPAGSTKKILVRALGPTLVPFGIPNALANPFLEIHDASGATVATNNDWRVTQIGGLISGDQSLEINTSGLAPGHNLESAIIANLAPGSYTAVMSGFGNSIGTGVIEAFDMSAASPARLANIATRGFIQPGDQLMVAGFIVQSAPVRAVVRAIGPSLVGFGISNALPDTTLQLRDQNGAIVLENDNWKTTQQQELEDTGLQPSHDLEAALVTTLQPGQYTAQVRGKNEASGIGVVEVYFLQ